MQAAILLQFVAVQSSNISPDASLLVAKLMPKTHSSGSHGNMYQLRLSAKGIGVSLPRLGTVLLPPKLARQYALVVDVQGESDGADRSMLLAVLS